MKRNNLTFYVLLVPVLLWLFILIVLPHIDLLISSFRFENDDDEMVFSFNNYLEVFRNEIC